jgi:gamma-polyglutamate biosynthesis protein CapA
MNPKIKYTLIVVCTFCIAIISYFLIDIFLNTKQSTAKTDIVSFTEKINPFQEPKIEQEPIKLLFVGDIMLDRTIRKDGEQYGYEKLFECLAEPFSQYDEVIGNLEGTVTNFTSVSRDAAYTAPESFRFTFDIQAVEALVDIGLSVVSLANNHIRDFGDEGINQTIQNTQTLGLTTFGDPRSTSQHWVIKETNGTKIAYIPYNQFFGTAQQTLDDLKMVQTQSDIQIIFAHWGDEYVPARADTKLLAHSFVDAGADLIIGAHPHVIQESEVYKTVPIYYSIGNFIFDQYFEEAVTKGLAIEVELMDEKILTTKEYDVLSARHKGTCFVN